MTIGPDFRPEAPYAALGSEFADPVEPAAFPQHVERWFNRPAAETVGLADLSPDERARHFAAFEPLPGAQPQPLAMRYHGHQFRHYNPDLGDGRGFLFAQMREAGSDRLLDFGAKGSGQTPWSRFGDGRLTLKGGVREVLAAEMLQTAGVSTSRAFSMFETGEALTRGDEPSPTRSSVLTRLSWSHIRIGSFQRLAYLDRADLLGRLLDHVAEHYYPESADAADRPSAVLAGVVARCADTVARWTAAGFVHGVLNTDNIAITGESFDYGPWRFLPYSDPTFTAAYFDHGGLYAFGRQAEAVFWNLQQLASCLTLLGETEPLIEALNTFGPLFQAGLGRAVCDRLGLQPQGGEADLGLAESVFATLSQGGTALRWEPLFHDWRGGAAAEAFAAAGERAPLYETEAGKRFRDLLAAYEPATPVNLSARAPEPEEMLIDEVEAIWAAIDARDDWTALENKLARLAAQRDRASAPGGGDGEP